MIYLKKFNESIDETKVDDLAYDINNICIDLIDNGYKIDTYILDFNRYIVNISHLRTNVRGIKFSLYDVLEEVAHIVDYTEIKGYEYSIEVNCASMKIKEFTAWSNPFKSGRRLKTDKIIIRIYKS